MANKKKAFDVTITKTFHVEAEDVGDAIDSVIIDSIIHSDKGDWDSDDFDVFDEKGNYVEEGNWDVQDI